MDGIKGGLVLILNNFPIKYQKKIRLKPTLNLIQLEHHTCFEITSSAHSLHVYFYFNMPSLIKFIYKDSSRVNKFKVMGIFT